MLGACNNCTKNHGYISISRHLQGLRTTYFSLETFKKHRIISSESTPNTLHQLPHLLRIMLGMIRILEPVQQTLHIGHVTNKIRLLILELIDEGLVLFDVAGFVEAEFCDVFDAHFVDGGELFVVEVGRCSVWWGTRDLKCFGCWDACCN